MLAGKPRKRGEIVLAVESAMEVRQYRGKHAGTAILTNTDLEKRISRTNRNV